MWGMVDTIQFRIFYYPFSYPKNLKINIYIYKTKTLPAFYMGEKLSLALREEHRLRVCETG
jgi:hypothetical protein